MNTLRLGQGKNGKAVFARKNFQQGECILVFKGKYFKKEQLPKPYETVADHYVQIGKNRYMGPSGGFDDFVNHSCNPNAGLRFQGKNIFLVAIKKIHREEEITWDYTTTIDEDEWEMECSCGRKNCRKRIHDFKYLPKKIQERYVRLNIVPQYILEKIKSA